MKARNVHTKERVTCYPINAKDSPIKIIFWGALETKMDNKNKPH